MQTSNEIPDWRITGDWWDLCNCAIGSAVPKYALPCRELLS